MFFLENKDQGRIPITKEQYILIDTAKALRYFARVFKETSLGSKPNEDKLMILFDLYSNKRRTFEEFRGCTLPPYAEEKTREDVRDLISVDYIKQKGSIYTLTDRAIRFLDMTNAIRYSQEEKLDEKIKDVESGQGSVSPKFGVKYNS